jgi:hypothetical protein
MSRPAALSVATACSRYTVFQYTMAATTISPVRTRDAFVAPSNSFAQITQPSRIEEQLAAFMPQYRTKRVEHLVKRRAAKLRDGFLEVVGERFEKQHVVT